ncbi:MAG: ACP S-malonyltransferase [Alkalibacterium sp.]|uniref:Malonyl CoA-acyl carrier protein transacylase n=1 Tax=Alkalibacterium gilvum TaxID=1130080 RepID=A0A1H6RBA5_9LACT|nr:MULTISPECIES: ACP S-malonyltransferase [Alkalibacterium]MDN6293841.1 ACP S-malonyltransferase [Alkalibacterium sp.]MDN6294781.1 ACP S-malonyltransferase [Alkalibacterium sp.]MDN6326733.1 ACP S-malonyltransferase [Alkalibacterium sp.]MDN6385162.1 ACP S-malonyltransferase [Alkalibacterium sp.]MDN6397549.1 ACP S-malonyltransferase [Alkalibacterium sp.]
MKTAFLFSGQGAQYNEMGKDFYAEFSEVRDIFDTVSRLLETDMAEICFNDDARLNETSYTQPAILTVSYAIQHVLKKSMGISADVVAGLSLGEYTALVSSGALSFEEAIPLVHRRGSLMEKAVPDGKGAMAAILGLEASVLAQLCKEVSEESFVSIANFNAPGQLVISGETSGVNKVMDKTMDKGAKKAVLLKVSGPFHTKMLESASREFAETLDKVNFQPFNKTVYTNVTADAYSNIESIKPLLTKQIASSVKFEQMIRQMISDGVTTFIQVGPGKSLRSFVKRIDKSVTVKNIEKVKQIDTIAKLVQS